MRGLRKAPPTSSSTAGESHAAQLKQDRRVTEEYSISYEAYCHFAFTVALYLVASEKPTEATQVVRLYLKEKWYCIPSDIPKPLTKRVYTRLVNNLIVDNCVTVEGVTENGDFLLKKGKFFPLWAWKKDVLEWDHKLQQRNQIHAT